jgi:DNA-binding transcriptional LysR family regulator
VRPACSEVPSRVATLRFRVFGSKKYLAERRGESPEGLDWLDWDMTKEHLPEAAWLRAVREGLGVSVLALPLAERYPELEAIEAMLSVPEIAVWLVGHRALRHLPRTKAVWSFLEDLTAQFP